MSLLDLPMRVSYCFPDGQVTITNTRAQLDQDWYHAWLQNMVDDNPDTIFFLVVDSTDVFEYEEPEFDYNTIVFRSGDSSFIQHTFSKECRPECYGQLDDCYYKRPEFEETNG